MTFLKKKKKRSGPESRRRPGRSPLGPQGAHRGPGIQTQNQGEVVGRRGIPISANGSVSAWTGPGRESSGGLTFALDSASPALLLRGSQGLAGGEGQTPARLSALSVGLELGALGDRQGDEDLGGIIRGHDHQAGVGQGLGKGVPGQHGIRKREEQRAPAGAPAPGQATPQHGGQGQGVSRQGQDQVGREVPKQEAVVRESGQDDQEQEAGLQGRQAKGPEVEQVGRGEGGHAWRRQGWEGRVSLLLPCLASPSSPRGRAPGPHPGPGHTTRLLHYNAGLLVVPSSCGGCQRGLKKPPDSHPYSVWPLVGSTHQAHSRPRASARVGPLPGRAFPGRAHGRSCTPSRRYLLGEAVLDSCPQDCDP
uniref:Uncharacterized protein n=1 Tax=Sus scrofa TaxID=9823 RepID=A0A8D0ME02_PIG